MKKIALLLSCLIVFLAKADDAFKQTIKTETETYEILGNLNFIVKKMDTKTGRLLFSVNTNIPNKAAGEMFYPGGNYAYFDLTEENMVVVYDVWQKKTGTKDCSYKLINLKTGKMSPSKLLYSTKVNSLYSSNEIVYKSTYSPDKNKMAVLKDNISLGYPIDPEVKILDAHTFKELATKTFSTKYENQKRVFDLNQFSMDNNGNISLVFHLMNEKTKITTKSFTAKLPFEEKELKNIEELGENAASDAGVDQKSHGRFYKSIKDYVDDKPIPGIRIKSGSFSWTMVTGTDFKVIDDNGVTKRMDAKNLPSELFTYKRDDYSEPYLMRIIDKKPYIVLAAGKLNYYSKYEAQQERYMSEGWDGEIEKFKEKKLEKYLEQYNLLNAYKKDKPKREFHDSVNDYFNKTVNWHIKYFNLLNEKM